ncbi:hypothetical protein JCM6882_008939 [Rhodosporidiobolus microsporus]
MKTVALLSGGKDSVYNLLHCVLNGHKPVAVASLGPPEGKDELDSFMYQTVGHSGLRTLAQALGLPFFSHVIGGTAVNVGGEYGSREGKGKGKGRAEEGRDGEKEEEKDETEDLYELLRKVKAAMPEVQAVSAGAILSNYQRVRVEHVCQRLGLTPIAYLWERDQKELLGEMVEAGMECVLVKVAGAGLQVDHLGKTLGEMQPTLHRLNQRYQLHICGEGGEYETFTVDCPLFKRRVILEKTTTLISDPNPFSTIAHLHLDAVSLGPPKPDVPAHEAFNELQARVRRIFEERGGVPEVVEERAEGWKEEGERAEKAAAEREAARAERGGEDESVAAKEEEEEEIPRASARVTDDGWVYFGEIVAAEGRGEDGEIEDEVRACFAQLEEILAANSASLLTLTHLTVLLSPPSSMALFPRINAVYASYFGTSPPTRACVAVSGSDEEGEGEGKKARPWRVKLEGVARVKREQPEERKALHVQSLSYWAAANIGPYSQSVKTAGRLYIAGQIPLIPASLTLPPPSAYPPSSSSSTNTSFAHHAALSLQHLRRIVDSSLPPACSSSPVPGRAEGAIVWVAPSPSSPVFRTRAAGARAVWDASERSYLEEQGADDEGRTAPLLVVEAGMLPKGAEVEWQVTWGVSGGQGAEDDEDEEEEGEKRETWARSSTVSNDTGKPVTYQCSQAFPSSPSSSAATSVFAVLGCSADESRPHPLHGLDSSDLHTIRAFYRPSRTTPSRVRALATSLFALAALPAAKQPVLSFVPSDRVATVPDGEEVVEHDVGFVLVGSPARA